VAAKLCGPNDCSITFRVPPQKTSSTEGSNNLTFDYSKRIRRPSEHLISASPICPLEKGDSLRVMEIDSFGSSAWGLFPQIKHLRPPPAPQNELAIHHRFLVFDWVDCFCRIAILQWRLPRYTVSVLTGMVNDLGRSNCKKMVFQNTTILSFLSGRIAKIMSLSSMPLVTSHQSVAPPNCVPFEYLLLDLCQPRCRLLQANTARWLMPYRCLSRQLNPKFNLMLKPMIRRAPIKDSNLPGDI